MAMEMVMVVKSIATETAAEGNLKRMERNPNGIWRIGSDAPVNSCAVGAWWSLMERTAQLQACDVAQLARTIRKIAKMVEPQTALQEAQWRVMKM
jgi:hypothetical protein